MEFDNHTKNYILYQCLHDSVKEESEYISASEIERFIYCPLSWWLERGGADGAGKELDEGVKKHAILSERVNTIMNKERAIRKAKIYIIYATTSAAVFIILALYFLIFYYFTEELVWDVWSGFLLFIAFTCLIIALFYFHKGFEEFRYVKILRQKYAVPEGDVESVDGIEGTREALVSERYKITGTPDYIIKDKENLIPVEIKTGKIRKFPFLSHKLQVATYCLLIEEKYNKTPPYGIIEYEDKKQHKIEFNLDLRALLLNTIQDMRELLASKDVHRNHHRAGKCKNCSRRDVCPEKLE